MALLRDSQRHGSVQVHQRIQVFDDRRAMGPETVPDVRGGAQLPGYNPGAQQMVGR
jgi:hypothetical protein